MTSTAPARRAEEARLPWWTTGDWNGLFGLGTNVLLNVIVIAGLCLGVVGLAGDTVYGRILPALAIALPLGNIWYAVLARRLARREGRTDVTALPYGPSVPHLVGVTDEEFSGFVANAAGHGLPLFDFVGETPWDREPAEPAGPMYRELFAGIPDGLSFLALHPNAPGEIEAIEPGSAHIRTAEYELFGTDEFSAWIAAQDLEPIGMRPLRDAVRVRVS